MEETEYVPTEYENNSCFDAPQGMAWINLLKFDIFFEYSRCKSQHPKNTFKSNHFSDQQSRIEEETGNPLPFKTVFKTWLTLAGIEQSVESHLEKLQSYNKVPPDKSVSDAPK